MNEVTIFLTDEELDKIAQGALVFGQCVPEYVKARAITAASVGDIVRNFHSAMHYFQSEEV